MTRSRPKLDAGDLAMLATALIWAGNNALTKAFVDDIGAVPYVFGRFAIVCTLLFAWLLIRGIDLHIDRADYGRFLLTGITGYALYNLLFTVGLEHTSAFSVAVLVALGPVFALIFAAVRKIERVRPVQWAGVACAMSGVTVFVGDKLAGSSPALGDILSIIAAASFAVYTLATRPIVRKYGSPVVTAWSALIGMIVSLPITLPSVLDQPWGDVRLATWGALFYSGAMSMLVAYTIWGWAIERKGVGRTVPYLYLVPLLTGAMAILFLDERLGVAQVIGGALVLCGVGLARRTHSLQPISQPAASPNPYPAQGSDSGRSLGAIPLDRR